MFESITFRAGDIKDLNVMEEAKEVQRIEDPAIVRKVRASQVQGQKEGGRDQESSEGRIETNEQEKDQAQKHSNRQNGGAYGAQSNQSPGEKKKLYQKNRFLNNANTANLDTSYDFKSANIKFSQILESMV